VGTVVRCMGVESDAEIYIKYRDDLLRYATSLVGPDQAEDVVSRSCCGRCVERAWLSWTGHTPI
jgi:DNA-directed RNA polymerase specialized sigma24 family protein